MRGRHNFADSFILLLTRKVVAQAGSSLREARTKQFSYGNVETVGDYGFDGSDPWDSFAAPKFKAGEMLAVRLRADDTALEKDIEKMMDVK